MTTKNGQQQTVKIKDDDETVDAKIKEQILKLRSVVDDDERRLYVDRVREDAHYRRVDANLDWCISVRQYLRGIKRLWADGEDVPLPKVDYYWTQVPLAKGEVIYPPDTNGFRFSLVQHSDRFSTDRELRKAIGLGPRGEVPEPYQVEFRGLSSILNQNRIENTWVITTHKEGPPPEHNIETVSVSTPIPKHILENAIEAADNFLQQAGLGFDIQMPAYMGGDEAGI